MSSAHRRTLANGACLALLIAVGLTAGCNARPRPRNLLVITLDTMRADRLPPYGFSGVETPMLDRLAAEGAVFERAFASVPLTLPSHASLFTGLYPPRLGVRDNVGAPLASEFTTMAEALRAQGLATAAFVASGVLAAGRGLDQGFMVYNDAASSRCSSAPRARRPANEIADEAVAWLSRHDVEPFFVWIHLYDTHRPYRLPAEYANRYADPYLDAIAFEDSQISRVVSHLEQRRLLDDTLMVIAGDHGESLGDHGEQSHGIFIYQEALHVPLVLRGPGIPPVRVSGVRRLVDVMPTVLDQFGATVPRLDGVSLSGDFRGSGPQQLDVYAESLYPQRFGWASLRSLRTDRYKVIEAPRPELYDLATDPGEQRNIFEEKRAIGAAMLERLRAFSGPGNPTLDPAPLIDRHVAARISSLGYIGGTTEPAAVPAGSQPDPKDKIETFNWMTRLQAQNASRFRAIRQECGSAGRP